MLNRRRAERLPAFLGGTIIYNRGRWSVPCIVKNLSRTGARVTAEHLPTLPEEFELHIPQKKAVLEVRVKWREGDMLGVEILQAHPPGADRPQERARAARAKVRAEDSGD